MEKNTIYLTCKSVSFYTHKDEGVFFEWIKRIPSIMNCEGIGDTLYLDFSSTAIPDKDLVELLALFYRYKIDIEQLKIFLNNENKKWFFENKKAFWHKKLFPGMK